jgi:20S proteasome alpha/beta subunit
MFEQGRLYQVEYAMEAISNAGAAIGILSKEGVVLIAEKKITSKVLILGTCICLDETKLSEVVLLM